MASARKRGNIGSTIGDTKLQWPGQQPKRGTGRKPLSEPAGLPEVCGTVVIYVCRKAILFDPKLKVIVYLACLAFGSLFFDFVPVPRSYFSNKDNVFNQYFVKIGWGWTLSVVSLFIALTSWTYSCGNSTLLRNHLLRMVIGTAAWYVLTNAFVKIETFTGTCSKSSDKFLTRHSCIRNGHHWLGFDVSGHAFLLVYCSLLIMEEARCFRGWERIGELIRYQGYDEDSPLKVLRESELAMLHMSYSRLTPYIKVLFVGMTFLLVIWDVMLIATIMYFHTMVQKLLGGLVAIFVWYLTYRVWYQSKLSPGLPGKGPFNYADISASRTRGRSSS